MNIRNSVDRIVSGNPLERKIEANLRRRREKGGKWQEDDYLFEEIRIEVPARGK